MEKIRLIKNIMYLIIIRLIYLIFFISIVSCRNSSPQLDLNVLINDTVNVNEKVIAKIYPNDRNWNIIKAYFDCENNLKSNKINILDETVDGCTKELFVRNDTIIIQFVPSKVGVGEFGQIKALMKRGKDEFKVLESDFNYIVIQ